jgi:hypothetical protein
MDRNICRVYDFEGLTPGGISHSWNFITSVGDERGSRLQTPYESLMLISLNRWVQKMHNTSSLRLRTHSADNQKCVFLHLI